MRVKEMHPLCCISLESGGIGDRSPDVVPASSAAASSTRARSLPVTCPPGSDPDFASSSSSAAAVAGVLYKWTNFGKGWRSRWFLLNKRDGSLAYSKARLGLQDHDVLLIGEISRTVGPTGTADAATACTNTTSNNKDNIMNGVSGFGNCSGSGRRHQRKTDGVIQLKISSFRESKSDDRKFYIFTATKSLHLRTDSKKDRVAWIQALVSTRSLLPSRSPNGRLSLVVPNDLCLSTERLKKRLLEEGIDGKLVKDCEQIVLSEFIDVQRKFELLCEERSYLLDTIRQLEAETSGIPFGEYQLTKHEFSSLGHGKYSSTEECSTTESSEEIEKQEVEEVSDEDESSFYDATEYFSEATNFVGSIAEVTGNIEKCREPNRLHGEEKMHAEIQLCNSGYPQVERRKKLPDPVEKEKSVSLWSMLKDNVGKDLTRVCLPVFFNEPISSLQKCFEDLEYSYLLDRAYEYGKAGNSLLRILNVAAFAVSGYASSKGRHCKPFNPLLGETYEADYPEKGVRFFSEKVSHHPTLIACHCEGRGWKFWGDSNLHSKFWGQSIQLDPVGDLTLEFDDGEIFQWSKVTTTIYNLIFGKLYCDHHGMMHIRGNRQYSCKLRFKEQSIMDRNPHQVHGFVEDVLGKKVATLFGKWDENMYYVKGEVTTKVRGSIPSSNASLLWQSTKPPPNLTRYNLTSFAITLNELTPGIQEKLPPTDSRLRPDQRHLENGEYEKANAEKLRLEKRQRMSRKLQEDGWKPRWFQKEGGNGTFHYVGGYWESREQGNWDGCPDIFGAFKEDLVQSSGGS